MAGFPFTLVWLLSGLVYKTIGLFSDVANGLWLPLLQWLAAPPLYPCSVIFILTVLMMAFENRLFGVSS